MTKKYDDEDGVWRTIGGRRIFIKNGQDLASAMKESGKFKSASKGTAKKEMTKEEKVLEDFKNSDGSKENFEKALNKISEMEYNNEINPDEYKDYISKIQKEYVEKNKKANSDREALRNTEKEYSELSKKMQADDYYYKPEDDRKLKELRAKADSERARQGIDTQEKYDKLMSEDSKTSNKEQFSVSELKKKAQATLPKEDIDTHEGDLYLKKTKESTELLNNMKDKDSGLLTTFKDQETGETWYDIPFANMGDDYKEKTWRDKIKDPNTRNEILDKELDESTKSKTKEFWNKEDTNDDDLMERAWQHHLEEAKKKGISPEELSRQKTQEGLKREGMLAPIDPDKPEDEARRITSNDFMNDKIRSRGKSKVEEDDLPKRTEIKTQGTSNRKEVSDNIQAHILEHYESPQDFIEQMDVMRAPTKWHAGEQLAKGGSYLIYYDDQREFLDNLKINPKGKKFSDDRVFQTYSSLIGRESAKLYDRIQKNSYKKYMKAHPLSKMSFEEFKDMNKK